MSEILTNAREHRADAIRRAIAHELSAEHHRRRGVQLGAAPTVTSAIVGSAVFVAVTQTLGLSGSETLSVPTTALARTAYVLFALLSVLAAVLTGLQTFLRHPEQSAKHLSTSADYARVRGVLDAFLARYEDVELIGVARDSAASELQDITKDKENVRRGSIPLAPKALRDADAYLAK